MASFGKRITVCITLLVLSGWTAAEDVVVDKELAAVRETITTMFPEILPNDVIPSPVVGWYAINKGTIVAYVSADGKYLIQGDIIDLHTQRNITEDSRNESRKTLMAAVPEDQFITFSPAKVRHSVAVFTDIDCTYCRRLHSQIQQYLDQGIEIKYLLYPRNGPHSGAWQDATDVWCAADRNDALTLAKLDKKFETSKCDASVITRNYALGRDIGLRGTPAIMLEDGTLVSGYMPASQLAKALDSAADE
jgi:thiol:disulfide interchange protein DsbC